jgi:hypothetical protein
MTVEERLRTGENRRGKWKNEEERTGENKIGEDRS